MLTSYLFILAALLGLALLLENWIFVATALVALMFSPSVITHHDNGIVEDDVAKANEALDDVNDQLSGPDWQCTYRGEPAHPKVGPAVLRVVPRD